jgi:hypothetical protein
MKEYKKGNIEITKRTGTSSGEQVEVMSVRITNENHKVLIDVTLDMADFARALTAQNVKCDYKLFGNEVDK